MKHYSGYPGPWPQQPYKPHEPKREDYIGRGVGEKKCIYADSEILSEDYEERLEEMIEDGEEEIPARASKRLSDNLTLQDILDLAPPDADPKDIILDLWYPRYVEYITVSFSYLKRNLEAEEQAYQSDLEKYQHDLAAYELKNAEYQKHLEAYQNWNKEQEIKELEEKLSKLKK